MTLFSETNRAAQSVRATRFLVAVASFAGVLSTAMASPIDLVSPEEAQKAQAAGDVFMAKSVPVPNAPSIQLLEPSISQPVAAPTRIVVKFQPASPAQIRPETFKAQYGAFKLDVTGRLLRVARVTPTGIEVSEANLPKGKHSLLLTIADSDGREGQQLVEFQVN